MNYRSKLFVAGITKEGKLGAEKVYRDLKNLGFDVTCAREKKTLRSQITIAKLKKIQYVVIVGLKEYLEKTVLFKDMRKRESHPMSFNELVKLFTDEKR